MKRITTLLLALVMCLSGVAVAKAVDLKVSGVWDIAGGWDQTRFGDVYGPENDSLSARQRFRTQVNLIASEQLQGVLAFEIGTLRWGDRGNGAGLDADGRNIEVRRAYIDWLVPNTDATVRMGLQNLVLPIGAGMGNPVMSDDVAAIMVSSPITDMFAITAFWARPFDQYGTDTDDLDANGVTDRLRDETDLFGLVLPVTGQGWSVTPWSMLGTVGGSSGYYGDVVSDKFSAQGNDSAFLWMVGGALKIEMFDPLTFGMDIIYGDMSEVSTTGSRSIGTSGWFIDAALDYKLDFATVGLFGWWASGDSAEAAEDGDLGRLPIMGTSDGDGFYPTSFGFMGGNGPTQDAQFGFTGTGTWGVGAKLADMTFIDKLSHTLRVAYYQGTNNTENARQGAEIPYGEGVYEELYLTTGDHVWEVNFDHKYQIYENLAAYLELGYMNLSLDEDTWRGNTRAAGDDYSDDAWKVQIAFRYIF